MGISLKKWLIGKVFGDKNGKTVEVPILELCEMAQEIQIRELAFNTCVNMIANAVGKCEFKTFVNHEPVKKREYYLLNYEPNINQNSTEFFHKLIYQLYRYNEALVISTKHRDGREMLVVADSFIPPLYYPAKMNEYTGVTVGEVVYQKTFYEKDVLHFKLNNKNIKPAVDAINAAYSKLIDAAMINYKWYNGIHLKVHVSQIESGRDGFKTEYNQYLNDQIKPFLEGSRGILPEFDGYDYTVMDIGNAGQKDTRDIRNMFDDIFTFTANAFGIPPVLLLGDVAGTQDAVTRWLTTGIDPLCDQIQEEITRKRYGFAGWESGNYVRIDTSSMIHFDMFANAANIEKLIGSGAYSINDVREAAGQTRIAEDWADLHWLTLNIGTMEAASRAAENQAEGGNGNATSTNVGN